MCSKMHNKELEATISLDLDGKSLLLQKVEVAFHPGNRCLGPKEKPTCPF